MPTAIWQTRCSSCCSSVARISASLQALSMRWRAVQARHFLLCAHAFGDVVDVHHARRPAAEHDAVAGEFDRDQAAILAALGAPPHLRRTALRRAAHHRLGFSQRERPALALAHHQQVKDGAFQEFGFAVAIGTHGGLVDSQKSQRFRVIDPHWKRVVCKQGPVFRGLAEHPRRRNRSILIVSRHWHPIATKSCMISAQTNAPRFAVFGETLTLRPAPRFSRRPAPALKGSSRGVFPVSRATALANAGASGGRPGSPMPVGGFGTGHHMHRHGGHVDDARHHEVAEVALLHHPVFQGDGRAGAGTSTGPSAPRPAPAPRRCAG